MCLRDCRFYYAWVSTSNTHLWRSVFRSKQGDSIHMDVSVEKDVCKMSLSFLRSQLWWTFYTSPSHYFFHLIQESCRRPSCRLIKAQLLKNGRVWSSLIMRFQNIIRCSVLFYILLFAWLVSFLSLIISVGFQQDISIGQFNYLHNGVKIDYLNSFV